MKSFKLALIAAAATVATSGVAFAQDDTAPAFSFNVGVASDYVFRGVSQTSESPQVFGGADVSMGQFYGGVWASNVDFGDDTDAEVDLYAGFKPTVGPVSLDLGVIYYGYLNEPSNANWAYWEAKAAGSVAVGPGTLGAAVYYSPDFTGGGDDDDALYYEVNGSIPLAEKVTASAAIGHQDVDVPGDFSYNTWNVGVGFALNDHLGLDLRYHDTDEHSYGKGFDSRGVISLKATF
ncbi:MAG: TorF family putative porin [Phenylobacterium sp.]|uniref:TorF family putative porin n=1 Tax=Phenylobacterium sp. TaxID=1871053 RepID=UPI002733477A|nr:TorF family putative porin [Phenylobacterium sp.]MDP3175137.1 TorF family putative porin [Phenylobacterium sp.]